MTSCAAKAPHYLLIILHRHNGFENVYNHEEAVIHGLNRHSAYIIPYLTLLLEITKVFENNLANKWIPFLNDK